MARVLIVLACLSALVTAQEDGSFWWLSTTASAATEIRCQCVPYFQCVDGVITTSGVGLLDVRFGSSNTTESPVYNVDKCPGAIDICCKLPHDANSNPDSSTAKPPTPSPPSPALPPDTPCDCVPFTSCQNASWIVSDGKGNASLHLFSDFASFSHSKCTGAFDVCCASGASRPVGSECLCVARHLCGDDGFVITDGDGLIDIRSLVGSGSSSPPSSGTCRREEVCCQMKGATPTGPTNASPPTILPGCGWRNVRGINTRVLGFSEEQSQFGEFPWAAAVLRSDPGRGESALVGGATLVDKRAVLTAAHKVISENWNTLVVRVGEWDTQGLGEPQPHQEVGVREVVVHPLYDPHSLVFDAALLILEEDVVLQNHINTICLAKDLTEVDWQGCVVNGWGVESFGGSQLQSILRSVSLPLVSAEACEASLRSTTLGPSFRLDPSFVCAGGQQGKDTCQGDGGGPLACPRLASPPGYYLLTGITSWGVGCGRAGVPGVYVNVPEIHQWVTSVVNQGGTGGDVLGSLVEGEILPEETTEATGGGRGRGRENRRRNQERREQRQQERREQRQQERREQRQQERRQQRQQEREERRRERQERRQGRRENVNGRK